MKINALLLTAAGMLLATSVAPSVAQPGQSCHPVPAGPGVVFKGYQYQQPDGTYDNVSDLVRDVNGTPCGVDCPAPSAVFWASGPSYVCD